MSVKNKDIDDNENWLVGDEEEECDIEDGDVNEEKAYSLDNLAQHIRRFALQSGLEPEDLRFHLFDRGVNIVSEKWEKELFFGYTFEDTRYIALLKSMYPMVDVTGAVANGRVSGDRGQLYSVLAVVFSNLVWSKLDESYAKGAQKSREALKNYIKQEDMVPAYTEDVGTLGIFRELGVPFTGEDYTSLYEVPCSLYDLLHTGEVGQYVVGGESGKEKDQPVEESGSKQKYIQQLRQRNFKVVTNETNINGKTELHTKLIGIVKGLYKPTPIPELGYKDKVYMINEGVLSEKGIDAKKADIWNPDVYTVDEDVMFRVFVREDDVSFTVLVKLPSGLELNLFGKDRVLSPVPYIFSSTTGRDRYTSSFIKEPRVCSLGKTRKVDCAYDCVEIVLAKDLPKFKNSTWSLLDYIMACEGQENEFSTFEGLSLGERIVIGVSPGSLKDEIFDCTGRYNTSVIIGGKAGSGKTTMFDSIKVQGIALRGDLSVSEKDRTDMGNGAAIMIDAKQEWVADWRKTYQDLGLPFYGFGGSVLPQEDIKWVAEGRGGSVVETIPFAVPEYFAGILFSKVIYEIIQDCFSKMPTPVKDMSEYNYAGGLPEVPRIPRTFVLVDEINELYASFRRMKTQKGIDLYNAVYKNLIIARLTRTSGLFWVLGGQDPGRQQIESAERENYGYNIFGSMGKDRYEYFGVTENEAVVQYEAKNGTDAEPNPIMQQGMFYAGPKEKTSLVKCLYLPTSERGEALKRVKHDGIMELDNIVRYGLRNGLFDSLQTILPKNNIIYVALRNMGIISREECEFYTNRLFNTQSDEAARGADALTGDVLDPVISEEDFNFDAESDVMGGYEPTSDAGDVIESGEDAFTEDFGRIGASLPSGRASGFQPKGVPGGRPSIETSPPEELPVGYESVYDGNMEMDFNPFSVYSSPTPMSCLAALQLTTQTVMQEIERVFGSRDRVESIEVTKKGLIINNVAFRPKIASDIISGMPYDIQHAVRNGDVSELFNFADLYKFKHLSVLRVDNARIAEGRMRREMGISPNKTWAVLFKKMRSLRQLYIGGYLIDSESTAGSYESGGRGGYDLMDSLRKSLGVPFRAVAGSRMARVWESRPVKIFAGAAGWTAGIKAMTVTASLLGVWGLLFGAIAGYGVYKTVRGKDKK